MQEDPATLELELVGLPLAGVLTAGLDGDDPGASVSYGEAEM